MELVFGRSKGQMHAFDLAERKKEKRIETSQGDREGLQNPYHSRIPLPLSASVTFIQTLSSALLSIINDTH